MPALDSSVDIPLGQVEQSSSLWAQAGLISAAGAGLVGALAIPIVILTGGPWWIVVVAPVVGANAGLAVGGIWITHHHRYGVIERLINAVEARVGIDIDGDGDINDVPSEPAGLSPEELDRLNFGFFVNGIWPPAGQYHRGTAIRDWLGQQLPEGGEMTRGMWEDYCGRLEKADLIRKSGSASNSPYILRATREQMLRKLAGQIVI